MPRPDGLLSGLRVVDCSLWQPGQYATQLLADLGAEVIKVEGPAGDRMRFMPDRFFTINGYKRSVVADLKTRAGRERVRGLAAEAEVFVENFRPGVAARLGVGYDDLKTVNPALVYCSISGYGQDGPLADQTGHDHNFQAYAGAIRVADGRPVISPVLVGDQGSGMTAAFAICAAVLCARRTGEGEHIDVSMADVVASWVAPMGSIDASRVSDPVEGVAGIGVFPAADGGHVVLGVFSEEHLWDALVAGLGLPHLAGTLVAERIARVDELNPILAAAIAAEPRDAIVARLGAAGVPVSPVLSREEMMDHPHFVARGLFTTGPDGTRAMAHLVKYRNHPALAPGLPPEPGDHGEAGFGRSS